jgi:hypothetical protein
MGGLKHLKRSPYGNEAACPMPTEKQTDNHRDRCTNQPHREQTYRRRHAVHLVLHTCKQYASGHGGREVVGLCPRCGCVDLGNDGTGRCQEGKKERLT